MTQPNNKKTHGMVLGKFFPPHQGHEYLIKMANALVDELTVVVGTQPSESISGTLRFEWMKALCNRDIQVVHLNKEMPQYPEEHEDFWDLWKTELLNIIPRPIDRLFASETYGWQLANVLSAEFFPIDISRTTVPISATAIRKKPLENFEFIAHPARSHFAKRISIVGPESTGKSTLCQKLAKEFGTKCVPEYARSLIEAKEGQVDESDMLAIAKAQIASEEICAEECNGILICDTDPLTTKLWSQKLFNQSTSELDILAKREYDLTLLLDVDVPWVEDIVRFAPDDRVGFYHRFEQELKSQNRAFTTINGNWEQRFVSACEAIRTMIKDHDC